MRGEGDARDGAIHMQRRRPADLVHTILHLAPTQAGGGRQDTHIVATSAQFAGEPLNMLLDTTGVAPVIWRDKSNFHNFTWAQAHIPVGVMARSTITVSPRLSRPATQ